MGVILKPFAMLLLFLYNLFSNYGIALILFGVIVKMILFPVTLKSKKSMIQTSMLSGKMQQLQKQYGKDRERYNMEVQKLYEREKVNPMGGCLWSLIPMFVLIGLFYIIQDPLTYFMDLSAEQIQTLATSLNWQTVAVENGWLTADAMAKALEKVSTGFQEVGYNQLYLYMEDMFFVPGRVYFGYMRGRHTAAELKELDDYAFHYGIELIPSIQALGHHEQYLRWTESADVRDTADVLLADSDTTYVFIEQMIRAVTSPLRSKKIVLGLDETHTLGLGEHLRRFGYEQPNRIFLRHLKKVFAITDALGLEGIVAGDMFFRLYSSDHGYYTPGTVFPPEVQEMIPANATLIYWHYGEAPGCDGEMLEKHRSLDRKTVFYGGTWTWSGHLPDTDYAIRATREALAACEKYGICDVIQTLWGDDGNECSYLYGLLTLQYTAEYSFGHLNDPWLSKRFRFCTGGDADAFYDMSAYQCILD